LVTAVSVIDCGATARRFGGPRRFCAAAAVERPSGQAPPARQARNQSSSDAGCIKGIGAGAGTPAVAGGRVAAVGACGAVASRQSTALWALSHTAPTLSPDNMNSGTPVCRDTAAKKFGRYVTHADHLTFVVQLPGLEPGGRSQAQHTHGTFVAEGRYGRGMRCSAAAPATRLFDAGNGAR
jgi:hypothetical protein